MKLFLVLIVLSLPLASLSQTVSGTIVEYEGKTACPFYTIRESDKNSTISDVDGKFAIQVFSNKIILQPKGMSNYTYVFIESAGITQLDTIYIFHYYNGAGTAQGTRVPDDCFGKRKRKIIYSGSLKYTYTLGENESVKVKIKSRKKRIKRDRKNFEYHLSL